MAERNLDEHVKVMSDDELEAIRRELVTSIGLMNPRNGMYSPAKTFLSAVDNEIAQRRQGLLR
jgi:hypothetical protein